jgi:hypothetical protein
MDFNKMHLLVEGRQGRRIVIKFRLCSFPFFAFLQDPCYKLCSERTSATPFIFPGKVVLLSASTMELMVSFLHGSAI